MVKCGRELPLNLVPMRGAVWAEREMCRSLPPSPRSSRMSTHAVEEVAMQSAEKAGANGFRVECASVHICG